MSLEKMVQFTCCAVSILSSFISKEAKPFKRMSSVDSGTTAVSSMGSDWDAKLQMSSIGSLRKKNHKTFNLKSFLNQLNCFCLVFKEKGIFPWNPLRSGILRISTSPLWDRRHSQDVNRTPVSLSSKVWLLSQQSNRGVSLYRTTWICLNHHSTERDLCAAANSVFSTGANTKGLTNQQN